MCRSYDLDTLRNNVAMVLQKNELFSGTICGQPALGQSRMPPTRRSRHACKQACADEFIERFPDGYDTYIEQGGTQCLRRPEAAPLHCPRAAEKAQAS